MSAAETEAPGAAARARRRRACPRRSSAAALPPPPCRGSAATRRSALERRGGLIRAASTSASRPPASLAEAAVGGLQVPTALSHVRQPCRHRCADRALLPPRRRCPRRAAAATAERRPIAQLHLNDQRLAVRPLVRQAAPRRRARSGRAAARPRCGAGPRVEPFEEQASLQEAVSSRLLSSSSSPTAPLPAAAAHPPRCPWPHHPTAPRRRRRRRRHHHRPPRPAWSALVPACPAPSAPPASSRRRQLRRRRPGRGGGGEGRGRPSRSGARRSSSGRCAGGSRARRTPRAAPAAPPRGPARRADSGDLLGATRARPQVAGAVDQAAAALPDLLQQHEPDEAIPPAALLPGERPRPRRPPRTARAASVRAPRLPAPAAQPCSPRGRRPGPGRTLRRAQCKRRDRSRHRSSRWRPSPQATRALLALPLRMACSSASDPEPSAHASDHVGSEQGQPSPAHSRKEQPLRRVRRLLQQLHQPCACSTHAHAYTRQGERKAQIGSAAHRV